MILDSLFKKKHEVDVARTQAKNDVLFLEQRLDVINAKAEEAASAGDEDEYIRLTDEASKISRRIYVKRKTSETTTVDVTKEEVLKAWGEYADTYNKNHKKKVIAYERAIKDLFALYTDLIHDQNAALEARRKCADCIGINYANNMDDGTLHEFNVDWMPSSDRKGICIDRWVCMDASMPLFIDAGLIPADKVGDYNAILCNHSPREV